MRLIDPRNGSIYLEPVLGPHLSFPAFAQERSGKDVPDEMRSQQMHHCFIRQPFGDSWEVFASLRFGSERLQRVTLSFTDAAAANGWDSWSWAGAAHAKQFQEAQLAGDLGAPTRTYQQPYAVTREPEVNAVLQYVAEYRFRWGTVTSTYAVNDAASQIQVVYTSRLLGGIRCGG